MTASSAGLDSELARHTASTRRTGAGSTGTARTEAGSAGRASRGMSAVTPPASTSASWVEKSSTRCSTRGFVSAPTNRRWNQS